METATNQKLWNQIKKEIEEKYDKRWNAYYSGLLVQEYKKRGGTFKEKKKGVPPLQRWFLEKWKDVGNKEYPVYRPTVRVNAKTPLTVSEISSKNIEKQVKLKQKIKGSKNLPPFI